MKNGLIEHASRDYYMPIEEVERIYELYPETFYEELEAYIKHRAYRDSEPLTK